MAQQNRRSGTGKQPEQDRKGSGRTEASQGQQSDWLDNWLSIEPDGTIQAASGKVELGTGTRTALAQIVAEELDVPFERVRMVMGDTGRTPDEGYTAGSMTVQASGSALRQAAAEARLALLEMAAEELDADLKELAVQDGAIYVARDPERKISYAELMGGAKFNRPVSGKAPLKRPEEYRIVGKDTPRVDIPGKLTGEPSYIQDLKVPGMLHAHMVHPPGPGAQFVSMDTGSLANVPGLVKIFQQGNFIGIVAEHEEQAIQAAKQLKVEWKEFPVLPRMDDLYAFLRSQPTDDVVLADVGDLEQSLKQAARQFQSTYYQPYHAHASIGPSCAIADVQADRITIWSSTTGPYPLRSALAQMLGEPDEKVHIIYVEGAASYGHNGADDVPAEAAVLSRAVGRPVRVQWSREDEFIWEPKAPAAVMEVRGGLDAQGNVIAWDYHVWSP
ncbi:MAG: molybdopterin cofactor-binding domain-containing protein, partial [Omnitrophica WOR_2 bacterium]